MQLVGYFLLGFIYMVLATIQWYDVAKFKYIRVVISDLGLCIIIYISTRLIVDQSIIFFICYAIGNALGVGLTTYLGGKVNWFKKIKKKLKRRRRGI